MDGIWCSVLHDYLHSDGKLFSGERRFMPVVTAHFLKDNGVVTFEGVGVASQYGGNTVDLIPNNSTIGLRSNYNG